MASLRERNRSRTRRDIEDAALGLFEEHGYETTTVEQIARAAGVSSATFFRYFGSKEEVLFANEAAAVDEMIALVAARADDSLSLAALSEPIAAYAHSFLDDDKSESQRLTRLVMTTRELEARSMRMRLRWERALARQLATEQHKPVSAEHVLIANLAIACLSAALWRWQSSPRGNQIGKTTREMFDRASAAHP